MARITTIESIDAPYRCACSNRIHTRYPDDPEYNHGGAHRTSPGDLPLSAVGTGATNTLRMYAARKEWPVDKIKIELRLEEVKTESGVLNKIHEALTVEGDLDDEQ